MLPAPYFHVTITVPEELRPALRSNQRDGYGVLIKATPRPSSSSPAIAALSAAPSA